VDVATAYPICDRITRTRAANFHFGIRLLDEPKRLALSAVYAFARRIDDIGDGELPLAEKASQLATVREQVGRVGGGSDDPVLVALSDAASRLPIPLDAFGDLIDGVEMDVRGTRYDTFATLEQYCRRVAGSIGRLSVGVFDPTDLARALPLADTLGVALQLTNILRDVREDLERGRVYLPREDFERFECELVLNGATDPRLVKLLRFEAARAGAWFEDGLRLLPLLEGRSAACANTMAGIYRRILRRIQRRPEDVLQRRITLPLWEKAWVAARSLAAGTGA